MPKKTGYILVDQALQGLDHTKLSKLGKKGAMAREQQRLRELNKLLHGAAQAEREANLHICPLKD